MTPYSRLLAVATLMRCFWIIVFFVLLTAQGQGAEIRAVNASCFLVDKCPPPPDGIEDSILIRGVIEKGDAQVFRSVVRQRKMLKTVMLRSPGGNVYEAMQIGRDIRRLLLETEGPRLDYYPAGDNTIDYGGGDYPLCVENGIGDYKGSRYKGSQCVCASACFLIYAAGARRDLSYVGIHRGYLNETISRDMELGAAAEFYAKISEPMQDYLQEMGVPRRYADIMLRTSSRDIYVPKYPEVMADFYGWVPEIEEWLIAKCNTVSEQKVQEMEWKAFADRKLTEFIEFRDKRELCIQAALLAERFKRQQGSAELPQGFTLDADAR